MTDLRDARLRQALDQAPDAGLQPPARVRAAIREAAHGAVQPAWRRWWARSGQGHSPSWMAALASVLVATLVVVIWQGQEVPGAREEPQLADRPASAAPVVAPAPAPAPAAAPAAAPPPVATPAPQVAAPAPQRRAPAAQPRPEVAARAAADAARQRESSERRMQDQAGTEAEVRQELAKAAPPPPPPPAAAPAPAMAPPPPPPPAPAPAPTMSSRFAASPNPTWTQVRISAGDRSVLVPRSQADALPSLINRMLSAPREPAGLTTGSLRLELDAQGVLEWSEEGWRFLPQGDAQRAQLLRADDATATALRAEAERLLGR